MKKILRNLLCIIAIFTSISIVNADYTLKGDIILTDMFDLSPLTTGHVGYLSGTDENGNVVDVWCIEPDVLTHIGDVYNGTFYEDASDGGKQAAGRTVIQNWFTNYQSNELYDTSAGYYSVQLAI